MATDHSKDECYLVVTCCAGSTHTCYTLFLSKIYGRLWGHLEGNLQSCRDSVSFCRARGAGILTEAREAAGFMYLRLLQSSAHGATYVALWVFK